MSSRLVFHSGITSRLGGNEREDMFFIDAMRERVCESVADIVREVFDLVRGDRLHFVENEVSYYFRGFNRNYECEGANWIPAGQVKPSLYYEAAYLAHESDFLNEALRTYPEEFSRDKTTFEMLTRMQHYGYPTRLLDVTPKITTAMGFAANKGYDGKDYTELNGFIQIFRVKTARIKYGTSDTVSALSNIARLRTDHVTFDEEGLRYLGAECQNERAGFYVQEGSRVTECLRRDLGKVFCVKPMVNNIRVNFQLGEFFLFGCNEEKKILDASFSENDYDNPEAATEGIAHIGTIVVASAAKKEINEMSLHLDIGDHRLYPDFRHHSRWLKSVYEKEV